MIEETCREIPNIDVREEERVEDKVTKLSLAIKWYKNKIMDVQFTYEMKINELQMNI